MIKPPFNYTGNKNRLIDEFATSYFPKDENISFLDLFGGGASVAINVNYSEITYNDISLWVPKVINVLKKRELEEILEYIKSRIELFNLSSTHIYGQAKYKKFRTGNDGLKKYNEKAFYNFRKLINTNLDNGNIQDETYLDILILMFFSFNNDIRFNKQGQINIPVGKTDYNSQSYDKLVTFHEAINRKKIKVMQKDFRKVNIEKFDFIYADPPYLISEAVYNTGWCEQDELDLYSLLDKVNKNGKKFALSNVLESKGKKNVLLENWVNKNGYKINRLEYSYKAASYNRNREDLDVEVVVTNV